MNNTNQGKRERSVAYPALSLDKAIDSSMELRIKLGKGPYGREDAAVALGHKGVSGASATKIASLVHFGLLTRNGNTYSQSELGERINHPLSDKDRTEAVLEVMKTPRLYKDLFDQFTGQAVPTQLANILIRKGISSKVAQTVAGDFKSSAEFSGCLKNGVLFNDAMVTTVENNIDKNEIMPHFIGVSKQSVTEPDEMILDFSNGIKLLIPRSKKVSDAIMDGGLKEVRKLLEDFSKKFAGGDDVNN